MLLNETVIGLLYLDSRDRSSTFHRDNLDVLTHLASVAAIKIENRSLVEQEAEARLLLEELRRASDIQRHLLPREEPRLDGYELTARTLPCLGVGGDWYDWMAAPDGSLCLCLGDIAGKGLSAALLMSSAHASVRALCSMKLPPDEMVERLNALVESRFPYNRFVTLWYSVLDPATHSLTYVNACQERPLYGARGRSWRALESCGPPLGIRSDSRYRAVTLGLAPDDLVLVYSDGLIDCRNQADEPFGAERLAELLREMQDEPPSDVADAVLERVDHHRGGRPHDDDVTLLLLKRLG
jgi:serine phosphatase RsbU (regulator of sigma subunit)